MDDFTKISRRQWSKLSTDNKYITADELNKLVALGDVIDTADVNEIYIPLIKDLHPYP